MSDEKRMKEIREDWFKDHKATYQKLSENTSTLTWEKEGTSMYYVRYIFDNSRLFVTGDIGDAVFCLTEKADLKTIAIGYNNHYLFGKLRADREAYDFNSDKAIDSFKHHFSEEYLSIEDYDDEDKEKYSELISDFISVLRDDCTTSSMLSHHLSAEYYDRISEFDCDCWEWIFDIGKELSWQALGWIVGLQMAYEQLKDQIQ